MKKPDRFDAKYWHEVMFANGVVGWMANDGLAYKFDMIDIVDGLANYEFDEREKAWWWNGSHDRQIAELGYGNIVSVNPMFVTEHMPEQVI
mgnify:CR=1 FL=1